MTTYKTLEIGQTFKKLTVLQILLDSKIEVKCDCGTVKVISRRSLMQGSATSCGIGKCHARYLDLDGQRFGKLTVLKSDLPKSRVLVKCDCSLEFDALKSSITTGQSQSCGRGLCHAATKNLIGKVFEYLTVLCFIETKQGAQKGTWWKCLCVCGDECIVSSHGLMTGNNQSCGCKAGIICSQKTTIPNNGAAIHAIFLSYKKHAEKLNISFLLSKEEFESLIKQSCHYCGEESSNVFRSKNLTSATEFKYNGIDRKDNSQDYFLQNCVTACADCNYAKRKRSHDEFIAHSKKIASRF